jgi:hypothetical protein
LDYAVPEYCVFKSTGGLRVTAGAQNGAPCAPRVRTSHVDRPSATVSSGRLPNVHCFPCIERPAGRDRHAVRPPMPCPRLIGVHRAAIVGSCGISIPTLRLTAASLRRRPTGSTEPLRIPPPETRAFDRKPAHPSRQVTVHVCSFRSNKSCHTVVECDTILKKTDGRRDGSCQAGGGVLVRSAAQ